MARHLTLLDDRLGSGELSSLIGLPIHSDGDAADLVLTTDEWAALLQRRQVVGWPLHRCLPNAGGVCHGN